MIPLHKRMALALAAGFTNAQMAKATGKTASAVSQWSDPDGSKTLSGEAVAGLVELTGWNARWWASGTGPQERERVMSNELGVAQQLSPSPYNIPLQVKWGELMQMQKLPARFSVAMPDDSLAGKIERGTVLIFDTDAEPTPGHGVLFKDGEGNLYIRRYVHIRGALWQAQATNDAYAPMDSERDGLVILAAMTGRLDGAI